MYIILNQAIKGYISDLANTKQKGKNIDRNDFLQTISGITKPTVPEYDEDIFRYFVSDIKNKESILLGFSNIQFDTLKKEPNIVKIEETNDAVRILEKYSYSNDCIVCDSTIQREQQLEKKKAQNQAAVASISKQAKEIIENIISKIGEIDPFGISTALTETLINGDLEGLRDISNNIKLYQDVYNALIVNLFIESVDTSGLISVFDEYSKIILDKPEFEDEDVIFIENFLNECLNQKIRLDRDENNNLRLLLGDREFLNHDRQTLMLSNGEQNFLSLSFELLKAKKVAEEIIILDDPISSFDSIYKNKIAYAIVKFLDHKTAIVLTHNTDLIKLLEHQHKSCFNLYYLNNTPGEENGFIHINPKEINILLYIHEFLALLRTDISSEIIDEKAFIISLIPFMRGYCQLVNNLDYKNRLTKLMHGYENISDNITELYNTIFSSSIIKNQFVVNAQDIVNYDIEHLDIIKKDNYPILSKTLMHTFTYLYLRLSVEKKLVEKYSVNTKKYEMLSDIIIEAFKGKTKEDLKNRAFFLSRKTLLNEFNHFEMDMNIFQPAIDITNKALKKEKDEILLRIGKL